MEDADGSPQDDVMGPFGSVEATLPPPRYSSKSCSKILFLKKRAIDGELIGLDQFADDVLRTQVVTVTPSKRCKSYESGN